MEIRNFHGTPSSGLQEALRTIYHQTALPEGMEHNMSAQADLVLNDGQTTPVARTFSARGATMQLARYIDVSGGISIGMPIITLSCTNDGRGERASWKNEYRITVPVLEVISGSDGGYTPSPKVAYNMFAKVELVAPNRSTLQNRKDLLAFAKNLLGHSVATAAFTTLDIPY